jgi:hypothetical protein
MKKEKSTTRESKSVTVMDRNEKISRKKIRKLDGEQLENKALGGRGVSLALLEDVEHHKEKIFSLRK